MESWYEIRGNALGACCALELSASSVTDKKRRTKPAGRDSKAQGVSPGKGLRRDRSPEGASEILTPLRGSTFCDSSPGLTPWALLCRPPGSAFTIIQYPNRAWLEAV